MNYVIPAKTFLLGEYVAIYGGPAILVTTSPCFEVWIDNEGLDGIHPHSPAGRWWAQHQQINGFSWRDPYSGLGGMGASSAQFVGAYCLTQQLLSNSYTVDTLMTAYQECAWQGQGLAPSGYDVVAQWLTGCVYIHKNQSIYVANTWPFQRLAFILLHTGKKLSTHTYLQASVMPDGLDELAAIVHQAKEAIDTYNDNQMIDAVRQYHEALQARFLVADHSLSLMKSLHEIPDILAMKGCGAMGADVLLLLVATEQLSTVICQLQQKNWQILATSEHVYHSRKENLLHPH